jgi:lipopolysaccharide/colanic/teichoic acid biosynthesis glycosyltransferase
MAVRSSFRLPLAEFEYRVDRRRAPRGTFVVDPAALLEKHLRVNMSRGWIAEFRIHLPMPAETVLQIARLAHETGRPLRVMGNESPAAYLPAPRGEHWTSELLDGQASWVLQRDRVLSVQRFLKQCLDAVTAAGLLLLLSPLLVCIALTVRFSSPGPPFYRWEVLGKYGRPFTGYKFRTMVVDAGARKAELLAHNEMSGPVFKMTNDPRVTSVGRWLRKFSLDELPQLWSVLKGDMSLVGPRPPYRSEYENFELWQMRKLSVKPGMTCLWQASGRNDIRDFDEWAKLDLEYIDNWSLWLDVKILMMTFLAVVGGTGK